ncbi:hypothetical protein ELI_1513 [Eubacterium callanderi]|uniref:Uncharacterized protein n=1 Tax=Eubacterium callanderi TaxID=53442 RepID=E3GLX8_9FIRM|nr:hypothetical protein ELI_1513 [Eubacterium callanderi]
MFSAIALCFYGVYLICEAYKADRSQVQQ